MENNNINWTSGMDNTNAGGFGDFNFGDFGGSPEEMNREANLADIAEIPGYIANRRNALTNDVPKKEMKELGERLKKEFLTKNPNGAEVAVVDTNGAKTGEMIFVDDKSYVGVKLTRSLDFDAFSKLSEGVYKVNPREAKAGYLVIHLPKVDPSKEIPSKAQRTLSAKANAVSDAEDVVIIKEKSFCDVALSVASNAVKVVDKSEGGKKELGLFAPYGKTKETKNSKGIMVTKFLSKPLYYSADHMKVKDIGYLGAKYAVLSNYVEDFNGEIKEVTNAQDMHTKLGIDAANLGIIKTTRGKDAQAAEQIAYEEYKTVNEQLGITKEMWESLRSKKKSRNRVSAATIAEKIKESQDAFRKYKLTLN